MKSAILSIACAAAGFLLGFGIPGTGKHSANSENVARRSSRPPRPPTNPWGTHEGTAAARMRNFASQAATLAPEDWPAFFQARMRDPEGTRLAERLWAEQDPQGFWEFLKSPQGSSDLLSYGRNLLQTWAAADPDAAMAAANEITDKRSSDLLRREVIETVMSTDLEKGLALAAAALDFNTFSWGPRDWMKTDPAAAVKGLAALPGPSEYRDFLKYAVVEWAKTDPAALLDWVKRQPVPERERWFGEAFKAAASKDVRAALDAATGIADPAARDAALSGVLSSGNVPDDQVPDLLAGLSIPNRDAATRAVFEKLSSLQGGSPAQIDTATRLLADAPNNKNLLGNIELAADKVGERDPRTALAWAASLPDAAMRRAAFVTLGETLGKRGNLGDLTAAISNAPRVDLSNAFFLDALRNLPADRRAGWLAQLPPDLAAWAKSAAPD